MKKVVMVCLIALTMVGCTQADEKVQLSADETAALKVMQGAVNQPK